MKRIIALLLALVTVAFTLVSCVDTGDNDGDATGTTTNGEVVDNPIVTEDKYATENPTLNFGEATIKIASRSRDWVKDEIWADAPNGETVNDAVFSRNAEVEKTLGIIIENIMIDGDQYAISDELKLCHNNAEAKYDFFANSTYSTIMYTEQGYFANLLEADYIEFEKPWYSQNFNDVASIGEAQYFVTGSLALSMYRFIFATFFNSQMIANVMTDGTDIYDIVNAGKWTIDYQAELAAQLYQDNGDGIKNEGDTFGFITNGDQIGVDPYWSALKLPILTKNSENYFDLAVDIARLSAAVDKINDLVWDCRGSYSYPHEGSDAEQITMRTKFSEGGAAMATLRIIECESPELRENEDYGLIPMPKFSENQGKYYSYAHDQITSFGIPQIVRGDDERFQRAGAVLNEMNRQSIIIVQPQYYELALKSKYLNDEKSWNMLDLIVTSLYLDGGILYTKNISSVHQELRTLIGKNNNTVSSSLQSRLGTIQKKLEDYMSLIKQMQADAALGA